MERGDLDLGDYPQGFFHIKDPPAPCPCPLSSGLFCLSSSLWRPPDELPLAAPTQRRAITGKPTTPGTGWSQPPQVDQVPKGSTAPRSQPHQDPSHLVAAPLIVG